MSRLEAALEEFLSLEDISLREEYLIEIASRFREVPESVAKRPYPPHALVPACESQAYFFSRKSENGNLDYFFAVENPHGISAKALAVFLQENLSGEPVEKVQEISLDLVKQLFGPAMSMGKNQGLRSMISLLRDAARAATHT